MEPNPYNAHEPYEEPVVAELAYERDRFELLITQKVRSYVDTVAGVTAAGVVLGAGILWYAITDSFQDAPQDPQELAFRCFVAGGVVGAISLGTVLCMSYRLLSGVDALPLHILHVDPNE